MILRVLLPPPNVETMTEYLWRSRFIDQESQRAAICATDAGHGFCARSRFMSRQFFNDLLTDTTNALRTAGIWESSCIKLL